MIQLPTERHEAQNYNPSLIVLFGKPKSGKSTLMASLDSNLILDLEKGYRALSVMSVDITGIADLFETAEAIKSKANLDGKLPYRFITIDNATRLEEMVLPFAAALYRKTAMGQNWGYLKDKMGNTVKDPKTGKPMTDPNADVRLLPNGSGYLYTRQAIRKIVDMFRPLCETLILVAHVKDKQIKKDDTEMSEMSVDLAGKMADIICGEADAVGYVSREGKNTVISFEGGDNTIREARPLHLRGKKIVVATSDDDNNVTVDMTKIFLENK